MQRTAVAHDPASSGRSSRRLFPPTACQTRAEAHAATAALTCACAGDGAATAGRRRRSPNPRAASSAAPSTSAEPAADAAPQAQDGGAARPLEAPPQADEEGEAPPDGPARKKAKKFTGVYQQGPERWRAQYCSNGLVRAPLALARAWAALDGGALCTRRRERARRGTSIDATRACVGARPRLALTERATARVTQRASAARNLLGAGACVRACVRACVHILHRRDGPPPASCARARALPQVHQLGMYHTEGEAAQAWDRVAWVYRRKLDELNMPHLVQDYDTQVPSGRACLIRALLCMARGSHVRAWTSIARCAVRRSRKTGCTPSCTSG